MKNSLLAASVLVGCLTVLVSCAGLQNLGSTAYTKANIKIVTSQKVVSDMQFVDGWIQQAGSAYSMQEVGVITANQLAEQGWHDVVILVEMSSRGNEGSPGNLWQISVFRPRTEPSAKEKSDYEEEMRNAQFFNRVATGTASQVQRAINSGATVNQRSPNSSSTPLMVAAMHNHDPAVITVLLEAGADIKARDQHGTTALMYAAEYNYDVMVIKLLLRRGADLEGRDDSNRTALMYAAMSEYPNNLTTLLEAGADVRAIDDRGMTAFNLANEKLKGSDAYRRLQDASR